MFNTVYQLPVITTALRTQNSINTGIYDLTTCFPGMYHRIVIIDGISPGMEQRGESGKFPPERCTLRVYC